MIGDDANDAVAKWEEEDFKAVADLLLMISISELKQVQECGTSREIWQKLEAIYQSKGPARKATLFRRLILHRMKEGDDVRLHMASFFDAVDKLQQMQIQINKELLSILLLYSLPSSFNVFRTAIETRDELPDPDVLKTKIMEESDSKNHEEADVVQNAMVINRKSQKQWKYKSDGNKDSGIRCFRCKKIGHKAAECQQKYLDYQEKAGRSEEEGFIATKENEKNHFALKVKCATFRNSWCLDSGCTSHMCAEKEKFVSANQQNQLLNLASNTTTSIKAKGIVKITTSNGKEAKTYNLEETLYVPDLRTNLLSVAKITDKGNRVIFEKDVAIVEDVNGIVKMVADRIDGLYYIRNAPENTCNASIESKNSQMITWHRRFGHLHERALKEIAKKNNIIGVKIDSNEDLPPCNVCIRGKLTRTPFPKDSVRSSKILEIIHTDVCGPMRTQSLSGARYVVTFIDDYSRWCEVRFLRKKSDVQESFRKFKALVENQTGSKIKYLQSDNGLEYCNKSFDEFLSSCGIKRRLTVKHNPEQNGVAERKNRTLIETARCLLIESGLPDTFWAEAVATANYVRNRAPSRSLSDETAFKRWTGRKPIVAHFRIFGSQVYVMNRTPNMGKFEPRSREGIFIGYSDEAKAYRVWIPDEHKIEASRDVKFLDKFQNQGKFEEFMPKEKEETTVPSKKNTEAIRNCEYVDILTPPENENLLEEQHEDFHHLEQEENEAEDILQPNHLEQEEVDVQINLNSQSRNHAFPSRGSGRPKIVRTGKRGRPRKVYQPARIQNVVEEQRDANFLNKSGSGDSEFEDATDSQEFSNLAEIPLKEAMNGPDVTAWKQAVKEEYRAQIKNDTWEIVDRPRDRNVISCRVILRNKLNADGSIERRKARLVARGFTQKAGVDFHETFSPVARITSIRSIMAMAANLEFKVHQLDVSTAFLNADLVEDVYMEIPVMLPEMMELIAQEEKSKDSKIYSKTCKLIQAMRAGDKVCLLKRALYGLRQAGREWNLKFDEGLREVGLNPISADPCVYKAMKENHLMITIIYVDDIILVSQKEEWIEEIKMNLMSKFEMRDLGEIGYCLGIQFSQKQGRIEMSQERYVQDVLTRFGMEESKPVRTPYDSSKKLLKPEHADEKLMKKYPYRELIGSLMYLAVCTRPDISFAVSHMSQFNDNYDESHWVAAKRVLRYLKGTAGYKLVYTKEQNRLTAFTDADWGACVEDRRSYTGYALIFGSTAVSWESRKQRTVALSSTEAEYMALSDVTKEVIYLQRFFEDIGVTIDFPTIIYNDNQGAQKLAKNPVFHGRTKHIDIRHHFVRDAVKEGQILIQYMPTEDMMADVLTKGLTSTKQLKCLNKFGLKFTDQEE